MMVCMKRWECSVGELRFECWELSGPYTRLADDACNMLNYCGIRKVSIVVLPSVAFVSDCLNKQWGQQDVTGTLEGSGVASELSQYIPEPAQSFRGSLVF